jgi:hypothetical protein
MKIVAPLLTAHYFAAPPDCPLGYGAHNCHGHPLVRVMPVPLRFVLVCLGLEGEKQSSNRTRFESNRN